MTDYIQITKVDCLFHGCFVCLQVKLRGVLNSLIDSEANYLKSLERLTNVSTNKKVPNVVRAKCFIWTMLCHYSIDY